MTTNPTTAAPARRETYTHCIQCGKKLPGADAGQAGQAGTAAEKHRFMRSTSIDIIDSVSEGGPRFCTLRCAAQYGVDTARGWERSAVSLKHAAQREAEAASKASTAAAAHAAAAAASIRESNQ